MALRQARRRRRMTITSLIDVIFLLLLFFMLASTFSKFSEVDVQLASSGAGAAVENKSAALNLVIGPIGASLDGVHVTDDEIASVIDGARPTSGRVFLAVRVSEDTTTQRMMDMLLLLNGLRDADIQLMEPRK